MVFAWKFVRLDVQPIFVLLAGLVVNVKAFYTLCFCVRGELVGAGVLCCGGVTDFCWWPSGKCGLQLAAARA
jgi:hypothetical protein